MPASENDFDIAKSIHDLLEPVSEDRRHRILRWVAESLDVSLNVRHSGGQTSQQHAGQVNKKAEETTTSLQLEGTRTKDIKSFVESKAPKNDVQYATVVAYYHRFEAAHDDRMDNITAEILQDSTRLVGRARLSNPNATLNNAKNLGYLDSPTRGEFGINTVGENLVAMTLPSDGGTVPKTKPSRKKRVAKKTKAVSNRKSKKKNA